MGRKIDRLALLTLAAVVLYIVFLNAFGSIALACIMTFPVCAALIRIWKKRAPLARMTRFQAKEILRKWAYGSDEDVRRELLPLIRSGGKVIYLPRHPTASVGMGDVFGAWKANRSEDHIVIAAPCYADGRARTFARTLEKPSVSIMDAPKLIPLIRKSGLPAPNAPLGRNLIYRFREMLAALPGRRPWYRNLLLGLAMMLIYLASGRAAYLILSVGMLLLAGIGVRMRA